VTGALILIVDDDPDIARFIETVLHAEGFEVAIASEGFEGIDQTRALRPDLVITNVMMGRIDGFDMTRRIRADPDVRDTPVLILTAKALASDKLLGLTSGADDYMIKPFDPVELVARAKRVLSMTTQSDYRRPFEGDADATERDALHYLEGLRG